MTRKALSLALVASALAHDGGVSAKQRLIGDVITEVDDGGGVVARRLSSFFQSLRGGGGRQRSLSSNSEVLDAMLTKEFFNPETDECLLSNDASGEEPVYGPCNIREFPYCEGDRPNICFNRINRQDAFWPDKHPRYYIDYNRVHCYPDVMFNVDFTCSSCSPGRWCMPEGRCILDENMYDCWGTE